MNRELGGYTNIIVDEYQDLNFLEQKLIDLLAGNPNTNVCIAGDDDQSIYAFRNARPEGILQFSARRDVTKFSIDVCGRCPRNIVEMANSLISQSPGRLQKSLVAKQQTDGYTAKLVWENLDDEVEGIVAAIAADRVSNRYELGQILVLTNRSKIGAMIKARLQGVDIPAHSYFRQEPVKAERAQIALAILRLLHGPDRVALRVILGAGGSGRFEAYARLRSLANQLKCTELEIMDRLVQKRERLPIKVPAFVQNYSAAVYELEALKGSDLRQIVDRLFAEGDPELAEIRDIAEMCLPQCDDSKQLLDKIVRRLTQLDVPENPNFVRVMSLHKSKGLTAECVYIVGALHGVLPSLKTAYSESEDKEAIEEQRRLMYVALTRATKQLVISYPRYLARADAMALGARLGESADGMQHRVHPSVYIRELGPSAPPAQAGDIWIRNYPPAS
jgi:superfamily I DNA/RNA helicase